MKTKILIISGVTGTGKTAFALELAKKYNGELISADSRQVYRGMDVITGKDLPENAKPVSSNISWRNGPLVYYELQGIRLWLNDIVYPNEEFNVSYWNECANLAINDIVSRRKLPIIVGGTGLYVKSLTNELSDISVKPNPQLRKELENHTAHQLFEYLCKIDIKRANLLNNSDKNNPRRLIRAIEISQGSIATKRTNSGFDYYLIALTAKPDKIKQLISKRIETRILRGARDEYEKIRKEYGVELPSLSATGYSDWDNWLLREMQYAKRQMTWFKKMSEVNWFDIGEKGWEIEAEKRILEWYNN